MKLTEAKEKFINAWGVHGASWGINRTMAQVHALLLVSPDALSAEEIMEELNISRGNANMNIRTLIEWGLVFKEIKQGVVSDLLGYFYFNHLCAGAYQVSCLHHVGCKPEKFELKLQENRFDTIRIEYHLQELEETKIVAYLFELSSLSILRPSELEKKFGMGKNLADQLKQLPGVSAMSTGNSISKPIIHGMHSNRILILNNGIRQEGQQWGSEHSPEIDPFLSTDVSIVKGANAIKYGSDAIAGVILTAPEKLERKCFLKGKIKTTYFTKCRDITFSRTL